MLKIYPSNSNGGPKSQVKSNNIEYTFNNRLESGSIVAFTPLWGNPDQLSQTQIQRFIYRMWTIGIFFSAFWVNGSAPGHERFFTSQQNVALAKKFERAWERFMTSRNSGIRNSELFSSTEKAYQPILCTFIDSISFLTVSSSACISREPCKSHSCGKTLPFFQVMSSTISTSILFMWQDSQVTAKIVL